jgi:LEA14-like dessication related protein
VRTRARALIHIFYDCNLMGYSMNKIISIFSICLSLMLFTGCAALNPNLKEPDVKLAGLRLLPQQSLLQRHIAIDLAIFNPNKQDLSVRSISYNVDIEKVKLLTGASDQVPVLKSMQETPVTLQVSIDILQALGLIEHFSRNGIGDKVNYNFGAVIDFSAWLPSMHVDRKGALPLKGLGGIKTE